MIFEFFDNFDTLDTGKWNIVDGNWSVSSGNLISDETEGLISSNFLIDDKYTIEVGGRNKKFSQIKDIQNSFIVADDIEVGFGAKIPLWLFGFLY